jgi:hypothetical protein
MALSEQFWRSAGHRAARSMTVMASPIHQAFRPHDDPAADFAPRRSS